MPVATHWLASAVSGEVEAGEESPLRGRFARVVVALHHLFSFPVSETAAPAASNPKVPNRSASKRAESLAIPFRADLMMQAGRF